MDRDFIAGLVRGLVAALRIGGHLSEVDRLVLEILDTPEFNDLTDAQKWQVQRQIRQQVRNV